MRIREYRTKHSTCAGRDATKKETHNYSPGTACTGNVLYGVLLFGERGDGTEGRYAHTAGVELEVASNRMSVLGVE
eukprot:3639577-Rhodomonas_salina.2